MKWINIKEQMPKEHEWVLIVVEGYDEPSIAIAWFNKAYNEWENDNNDYDSCDVNWWQPLPDLPKSLKRFV